MERKYVFVTGGVVSGLGKGVCAASLGLLLKQRGLKVAAQKLDPYLNVDPGTMSPYQHGEVFVTEDGAETDLDLGHYERFIDENLNRKSNLTSGKVFWNILNRERSGGYLGRTVQIIPHVTDEIRDAVVSLGEMTGADVVITEIGGTIGDIESQPFLEAARQLRCQVGFQNTMFIHVVLVPYLACSGEYKTKPSQHSVHELQGMGIMPDCIIARSDSPLDEEILAKMAMFCNVDRRAVIGNENISPIYAIPLLLHERGFDDLVVSRLSLECGDCDLEAWRTAVGRMTGSKSRKVRIALCGKYVKLHDAYLSINEALLHAACWNDADLELLYVDAQEVEKYGPEKLLEDVDGILVPGGFGSRGIEGMVQCARFARQNDIPYLGICLGMQVAVIEAARSLAHLEAANSREFDPDGDECVIDLMDEQRNVVSKGGTMRLGAYECRILPGSLLHELYAADLVQERHRHRYEVSPVFRDRMEDSGIVFSGTSVDGRLVEAMENPSCRFFVAVQFHPEFKSRPNRVHPLFDGFVRAALA